MFFKRLVSFSFRLLWRLVLLIGFLLPAGVLYLAFFQAPVPERVLRAALMRIDTPENPFLLELRRADISLLRLNLHDIKIIEKGSLNPACMTASRATCHLTPVLSTDPRAWISRITIDRPVLPAIPERLHASTETSLPSFTPPATLHPIVLELTQAKIFGVPFRDASCLLSTTSTTLVFDDLAFSIDGGAEYARGALRFGLEDRVISFSAEGSTSVMRIATFIESWGFPFTLGILRRITMEPPYPRVRFSVESSLIVDDVTLSLDFENATGTYLAVPFTNVSGTLAYIETNNFQHIGLRDFSGLSAFAPARLDLVILQDAVDIDAAAKLHLADINLMAEHPFTPEQLKPFATLGPVFATIAGRIDTHTNNAFQAMNFSGAFSTESAAFLDLPFDALSGNYQMIGSQVSIESINLLTPCGGQLSGNLRVDLLPDPGTFTATLHASQLPLAELAPLFNATNNTPVGELSGTFTFTSSLDNPARILDATGDVAIANARLARIPLFAWFTEFMAGNIPGVDWLTQQTDATCEFAITDGMLHVNRLAITGGGAFTIRGRGTYSIANDELDLIFKAHLFGDRTFLGGLVRNIIAPVNYLLLTFHVTGPRDNPQWRNVGMVPRFIRGIGSAIFSIFSDDDE